MKRDFPFPAYPNGWFAVLYSDELERGQVENLRYFGKEFVLFRDDEGAAHILDAHCPHLGAHLGHGGKVKGSEIECPFHAWRFGTDGRCTAVPYAKHLPRKADEPRHVTVDQSPPCRPIAFTDATYQFVVMVVAQATFPIDMSAVGLLTDRLLRHF